MVLFAAAGLAGLLGRGPFSHRTESSPGTGLSVDFEPIARAQTGTQITLHLDNLSPDPTVSVFVGTNIVEPMGLQRILPEPVVVKEVADGMILTIAIPPDTRGAEVRFMVQPVSLGPNELIARLEGHPPQRWTQFVVP